MAPTHGQGGASRSFIREGEAKVTLGETEAGTRSQSTPSTSGKSQANRLRAWVEQLLQRLGGQIPGPPSCPPNPGPSRSAGGKPQWGLWYQRGWGLGSGKKQRSSADSPQSLPPRISMTSAGSDWVLSEPRIDESRGESRAPALLPVGYWTPTKHTLYCHTTGLCS